MLPRVIYSICQLTATGEFLFHTFLELWQVFFSAGLWSPFGGLTQKHMLLKPLHHVLLPLWSPNCEVWNSSIFFTTSYVILVQKHLLQEGNSSYIFSVSELKRKTSIISPQSSLLGNKLLLPFQGTCTGNHDESLPLSLLLVCMRGKEVWSMIETHGSSALYSACCAS